jgi:DNA-binding HxlR family transcriptional regulator
MILMAKRDTRKDEQEKAILKFCTSPKKNKEIKENIVKRQNTLSDLLKDLQTKGLLTRTIEST